MINQQTQALINRFKKIPLFSEHKAILIGGTACFVGIIASLENRI
jgi:hypothetical protein